MICQRCDRDLSNGRQVVLELGALGGRHTFCSDRCEHAWMRAQLVRLNSFLNRIYIRGRGLARDVAHVALHTNISP